MAQELINIGVTADDGTGDTIRRAGIKINNNFTELYADPLVDTSLGFVENEISSAQSNADIVLKPSGTGSVVFPAIRFNDNNIEGTRTNEDIKFIPNGSGQVVIDGVGFSGTSITATDSTAININENLSIDGALTTSAVTLAGAVSLGSTLEVDGSSTLSTLTVSGVSSFAGTTTVDNLTFNDDIIGTSSNADLNLTPGGTGVVNVSNLTIDSSINLTDNVIKVTRSNDNLVLSGNGTGSVKVSGVDVNSGTVDNTIIGSTTPASGTFSSVSISLPGGQLFGQLSIRNNNVTTKVSNADLVISANGSGNVLINDFSFPKNFVAGQFIKTDGNKNLSLVVFPIVFAESDIQDGTATITGDSSTQTIDSFSASTYRIAKYNIQISDSTADRYALIEANVSHDGTNAYISTFGKTGNGVGDGSTAYDSMVFTADISGGNVRLRGTVNNTNTQVIKFVKRVVKV